MGATDAAVAVKSRLSSLPLSVGHIKKYYVMFAVAGALHQGPSIRKGSEGRCRMLMQSVVRTKMVHGTNIRKSNIHKMWLSLAQ